MPEDKYLLLSNHALLTQKQLFHRELLKKYFSLECSLNVPWIFRTLQRWGNSQWNSRKIACRLSINETIFGSGIITLNNFESRNEWYHENGTSMLLGTLGASLLGYLWTGKGVKRSRIPREGIMRAGEGTIRADQDF